MEFLLNIANVLADTGADWRYIAVGLAKNWYDFRMCSS